MSFLYDFKCIHNCGTVFERFAGINDKHQLCPACGTMAERMISTPKIKLEGWSGDFPSASQKWEKMHKREGKSKQA